MNRSWQLDPWRLFALGCLCGVSACLTPSKVTAPQRKPAFDIVRVRRIAIAKFDGDGGPAITQAMTRALTESGVLIVDRSRGADALLTGMVVEYKPDRKWMVFLGRTQTTTPDGRAMEVSNPVVAPGGRPVLTRMGENQIQMVCAGASVSVIARLLSSGNGDVMWAGEFSYEGLDLAAAQQPVISTLAQSLRRSLPRATRPPPELKKG